MQAQAHPDVTGASIDGESQRRVCRRRKDESTLASIEVPGRLVNKPLNAVEMSLDLFFAQWRD